MVEFLLFNRVSLAINQAKQIIISKLSKPKRASKQTSEPPSKQTTKQASNQLTNQPTKQSKCKAKQSEQIS